MKNLLRYALLVLLSITLPAYGLASIVTPPCPMQASHAAMSKISATAAIKADCCDDHADAKSGMSCKAGQHCSTGMQLYAPTALSITALPAQTVLLAWPDSALPDFAPVAFWRPPRLL